MGPNIVHIFQENAFWRICHVAFEATLNSNFFVHLFSVLRDRIHKCQYTQNFNEFSNFVYIQSSKFAVHFESDMSVGALIMTSGPAADEVILLHSSIKHMIT